MGETETRASFGVFRSQSEAKAAVKSLHQLGFDNKQITVLHPDQKGAKDFLSVQKTELKRGALIGAALGTFLGFVASTLFMIGIIESPFNFLISAVGGILSLVAIVVLSGAVGAGVGALVGIGTPDPAAKRYGQYLNSGGILISVFGQDEGQIDKAQAAMLASGAQDVQLIEEYESWIMAIAEKDRQALADVKAGSGQPQSSSHVGAP